MLLWQSDSPVRYTSVIFSLGRDLNMPISGFHWMAESPLILRLPVELHLLPIQCLCQVRCPYRIMLSECRRISASGRISQPDPLAGLCMRSGMISGWGMQTSFSRGRKMAYSGPSRSTLRAHRHTSQNFSPSITVSPSNGTVRVIYYTNRLDGFLLDVFVAESINSGLSFVNRRVTDVSTNPNGNSPTPVPLIGDYITAATIFPDTLGAVWNDTRLGKQDVIFGN